MKKFDIESDIESYLKTQAEKHGFLCYKFVSPGHNGVPDRILIGYGATIFIELKAPNKKPRIKQTLEHKKLKQHGAEILIIDTKQKVDELFNSLKNRFNITPINNVKRCQCINKTIILNTNLKGDDDN